MSTADTGYPGEDYCPTCLGDGTVPAPMLDAGLEYSPHDLAECEDCGGTGIANQEVSSGN